MSHWRELLIHIGIEIVPFLSTRSNLAGNQLLAIILITDITFVVILCQCSTHTKSLLCLTCFQHACTVVRHPSLREGLMRLLPTVDLLNVALVLLSDALAIQFLRGGYETLEEH